MTAKQPNIISDYILHDIESIENNAFLFEETNFDKRTEAIDFIDFHIIDRVEGLPETDQLIHLKNRAEKVKTELETVDIKLFQKLKANIRNGAYTNEGGQKLIHKYVDLDLKDSDHQREAGYDNLDVFINGLFSFQVIPEQTRDLESGMVFYQKTPARIIFELVEKITFTTDDVFFDLGSGLGHAAMLVNLLTSSKVIGVEFEPTFCKYASDCAENLNLSGIEFINADAREADYSSGTIFFMYTPFSGKIMEDVLEALKKESLSRKIKIITYGPCTVEMVSQNWLVCERVHSDNIYSLTVFSSL